MVFLLLSAACGAGIAAPKAATPGLLPGGIHHPCVDLFVSCFLPSLEGCRIRQGIRAPRVLQNGRISINGDLTPRISLRSGAGGADEAQERLAGTASVTPFPKLDIGHRAAGVGRLRGGDASSSGDEDSEMEDDTDSVAADGSLPEGFSGLPVPHGGCVCPGRAGGHVRSRQTDEPGA